MRVLSLDIAATSGFAVWEDGVLIKAGVIRRMPKTARHMEVTVHYPQAMLGRPQDVYDKLTERAAWQLLLGDDPFDSIDQLVIEDVHVRFAKTAMKLGEHHGRVIAHLGFESYTKVTKVTNGEWRKTAEKRLGAAWPKKKKGKSATPAFKAESMRLVHEHWGIDAGDNASDAILVGHWWNIKHAPFTLPESYPRKRAQPGRAGVAGRAARVPGKNREQQDRASAALVG